MNVKSSKQVLDEVISSGCKTVAELALYLKRLTLMQTIKLSA